MVPDIAKAGRSFNGAFAYYLHDKRQAEAAAHPDTAERVAWTETRNLATANLLIAKRIMIGHAQKADELKAAAGVKNTGRKSNAHVYAFSLSWRAGEVEGLDRAEMLRSADDALKFLGGDHLQTVIVAHTDRDHPHLHVILNRVQDDGRLWNPSFDKDKFSAWANAYERDNGKIVTPVRDEKWQRRRDQEAAPPAPTPEKTPAAPEQARTAPQPPAQRPKPAPKAPSEAALLKALTDAQKARHAAAWPALSEKNKADREAVFATYGEQIKAASARHKELSRPLWAQHFRQERQAAEAFTARERDTFGRIANALAAAKHQMASGAVPNRGLLSLTFANVLNSRSRGEAFTAQQETKRGEVARQLRTALDAEVAGLKATRSVALDRQRQAFTAERQDLIDRQTAEKAKNREAWKQVYSRNGKEPEPRRTFKTREQWQAERAAVKADRAANVTKPLYRRDLSLPPETIRNAIDKKQARAQIAPPPLERKAVKTEFDKARGLAPANPAPHPTERKFVSSPAPTPSPAGVAAVPARAVQDVPRKPDPIMPPVKETPRPLPAKDWTKAATPAQPATPLPAKDWSKAAAPPSPAPLPPKDWGAQPAAPSAPLPPKDWGAKPEPSREIKPLPERGKDRDWER